MKNEPMRIWLDEPAAYTIQNQVLGLVFLAFIPFNRKSQRKPSSVYAALIVDR